MQFSVLIIVELSELIGIFNFTCCLNSFTKGQGYKQALKNSIIISDWLLYPMPRKALYSNLPVKKTGQQNDKLRFEDKFISVVHTPLILTEYEKICRKINQLSSVLVRHALVWNKQIPNETTILQKYIEYYYECYQFDQFDSSFEALPSLDINLHTVSNEANIYKACNIFHNDPWPIRFHSKFVAKTASYAPNQIKYVLSFIKLLAQGEFYGRSSLKSKKDSGEYGYVYSVSTKSIPYNRFFIMKLFREKNLLFSAGVQKVPVVKNGVIKRYEYSQYLYILDILSDTITQNHAKIDDAIQRFQDGIKEDVAKRDHSQELTLDDKMKKKTANFDYMFQQYENPYINIPEIVLTELHESKKYDYRPLIFKPLYVSTLDTSSLIFDKSLKRWISKDYLSNIQQKAMNQYQRKVNQELIKRFVDFQSAKTLVELLTKIPNFKVELTDQQKDVIGQNGNVLVIGRSGTGKTTCAVLRLFAIQMLFKIRLSLSKKKHQQALKDTRCSADDIDKTIGLHCVFLTASPVLTNQIERYYKKLTDNIKLELEKKKKKVEEERKKRQSIQGSMMKKQQVLEVEIEKVEQLKEQHKETLKPQQKGQEIKQNSDSDSQLQVPEKLQVKKSKQVVQQEEEMNKQLGGLNLQQKLQNENFQEDEDNYDEMKDQLEEKMKKFKSLSDLTQEDYPGFFTVKSFIMMIDGTLAKPFFIRKKDTTDEQSQATWHNQKKGVMMIENYYRGEEQEQKQTVQEQIEQQINYSDEQQLEHEYLRQIQLRQNKQKQQLTDKLKKNKKALSFQVDYDYFYTYFWPNVRHKHYSARNITPHLVWTEIYSTIKGGASAHLYPGFYLSQKVYISESTNSFLTKDEKLDVYETFCQYERWKINNGGYDMMDAVNYMLNFIRFRGYTGPEIHYVMIDEVQDLPHSIVYLLSKTVRYGVFYSGDTAQTIAKGVGFRFCDLKNLFDPKQFDYSLQLKKPIVKQLTVNFRSHNNILQLANSVVSSIEILFPKTIDRLKKQVSNLSGPKPMILAEGNEDLLFFVLCGDDNYKKSVDKSDGLKKPPLEFGCDQVIIVRDQESKNKIPSMLQHALCLTIYEAKGLEFNDVILFNFFSESKCPDKWNLIKFLKVVISEMDASQYDKSVTKHAREQRKKEREQQKQAKNPQSKQVKKQEETKVEPQQVDVECIVERSSNKVNIKKIVSDAKLIMKDINDFAELCSELKMLYTAITRPKNTLIIYDEDSTARKTIEKLWERLEVVEMVSKQLIEESNKKSANKPESQELKIFKTIVYSTDQAEWKKQGMKMYARGFFEQAMKCFQRSGHDDLYKKALANNIADLSTKKLIQIESQRKAIANKIIQYQKMSDSDLSKLKKKLKKDQSAAFARFEEAGKVFQELQMYKQAGQCFFSGRKYQSAYQNFSRAKMNKQAGQSLQMLNKYREASEFYEKEGLYLKVIECLDMINEWQEILRKIQKFSHEMTDLQKKSLFKKYSALALQELVYEIEFENQPQESKPENNRVQVIKQEDDDEEQDWDEDEDPEVAAQRSLSKKSNSLIGSRKLSNLSADNQENIMSKNSVADSEPRRKESLVEEDKIIKQSVYQHMEQALTKHEKQPTISQQNQNSSKIDDSSFAELNESSQHDTTMNKKEAEKKIMQSMHEQNLSQNKQDPTIQSVYETNNNVSKQISIKKTQNVNQDNSFAELNQSASSFADLNSEHSDYNSKYPAELEPDIESIRSMADPQDPWIQSALSEIPAKTNTEYSIIDQQQNYNPNVRIIKTKGNIVVQDQIMTKIVNIVAIVNDSVEQFFKQFKGYQSLTSMTKSENNEDVIDNRPEISEFEDVDPKFINIILDTLESFKLYKLCLFVCNRYHLPHKAGRYLVSMALKYATNSQINNTLNPALIAPSLSRKAELEKGILASIALHAMFENVSPDFLKIKVHQYSKEESKNSLGSYFIEGLILEGLYKKAVFMVNPEQSLKILKNFCDNEMYLQMYKQKFLKKSQDDPIEFLSIAPKSQLEEQFTIVKLEQALHQYNIQNKMEAVSTRYYKQFGLDSKSKITQMKFAEYTPLLRALFDKHKEQVTQVLEKQSKNLQGYLKNGPNFKIYDLVAFLTTSLKLNACYQPIFQLSISNFMQIFACLRLIRRALRKQHSPKSYQIIQSVFSVFMCRMIDPSKSMKFINDGYSLVHRTSTICNQFVEELKKNKNETAFFFEQDYNYVLVKTSKLVEIIAKKFDGAYSRFLKARLEAKIEWIGQLHYGFLATDFQTEQSEYLLKSLIRQELRQMNPKQRKIKKQTSTMSKKSTEKPKFNYKTQGRPELVVELVSSESDQSSEQQKQRKHEVTYYFIFPDVNSNFRYFADLSISTFNERIKSSKGKHVPGRMLYCAGLNDTFKEYVNYTKEDGSTGLYNAMEFRKFRRLDLYADNLLSAISELSYTQRHLFSAEILIHLLVQYKCLVYGKNFKLDIPRRFLKFFPRLELVEVIDSPLNKQSNINDILAESKNVCAFSYDNLYSSQLNKKQVADLICEFLEVLKNEQSHKCYNIQKFVLIFIVNMPNNKEVYESLRDLMQSIGYEWTHPILTKIRGTNDYKQFVERRKAVLDDKDLVKNSDLLHEIRVTDRSDIEKDINESQNDYQIKEKIVQARTKAVHKIITWWRIVKKKQRQGDETQIIKQNRIVKSTFGVKYLPLDDHFILRSSIIRDVLLTFYLRNIVTSSLDYHFILMTLNQIEDLRQSYIKAYASYGQIMVEMQDRETDFEREICNIESTIEIWKNDSKWLKDRNLDLKRKKVFEVKWMTKNNVHKMIKKRANLNKQRKLEIKKKFLKKHQL